MADQGTPDPDSPSKQNALNANAQAFIPASPNKAKANPNASPAPSVADTACFAKSKLETIPESPSVTPLSLLKQSNNNGTLNFLQIPHTNSYQPHPPQPHLPHNFLQIPHTNSYQPHPPQPHLPHNFRSTQIPTHIALVPAIDPNGNLVMIPPIVAATSHFVPLNVPPVNVIIDPHTNQPIFLQQTNDQQTTQQNVNNHEMIKRTKKNNK
eukprot:228356_1